jgi:hypothetical protein
MPFNHYADPQHDPPPFLIGDPHSSAIALPSDLDEPLVIELAAFQPDRFRGAKVIVPRTRKMIDLSGADLNSLALHGVAGIVTTDQAHKHAYGGSLRAVEMRQKQLHAAGLLVAICLRTGQRKYRMKATALSPYGLDQARGLTDLTGRPLIDEHAAWHRPDDEYGVRLARELMLIDGLLRLRALRPDLNMQIDAGRFRRRALTMPHVSPTAQWPGEHGVRDVDGRPTPIKPDGRIVVSAAAETSVEVAFLRCSNYSDEETHKLLCAVDRHLVHHPASDLCADAGVHPQTIVILTPDDETRRVVLAAADSTLVGRLSDADEPTIHCRYPARRRTLIMAENQLFTGDLIASSLHPLPPDLRNQLGEDIATQLVTLLPQGRDRGHRHNPGNDGGPGHPDLRRRLHRPDTPTQNPPNITDTEKSRHGTDEGDAPDQQKLPGF